MLLVNTDRVLATGLPIEWREFTRYFAGFGINKLDQEVVCYHKKHVQSKNWKDIWSGQEIFVCRDEIQWDDDEMVTLVDLCNKFGQLIVRDNVIYGLQVHIPLTSEFLGKEDYFTEIVDAWWQKKYLIVQTILQTKDYPLVQWSITDPGLLVSIVAMMKKIEKTEGTAIVEPIASLVRRDEIVAQLVEWSHEQWYDASLLDEYDVALIKCDS